MKNVKVSGKETEKQDQKRGEEREREKKRVYTQIIEGINCIYLGEATRFN